MEITIPIVGGFVGPGFSVTGTVQGPTPIDDFVEVSVTPVNAEQTRIIWGCRALGGGTIFSVVLGSTEDCPLFGPSQGTPGLAQGQDARLVAVQRHADGTQVDSLSIAVKWDGAGMLWLYGDLHSWGAAGQGSFTPSDRDVLEHIDSAVWKPWPNG